MRLLCVGWVVACLAAGLHVQASELGRFEIREPLGKDWPGEWIRRQVQVDTGGREVRVADLRAQQDSGISEQRLTPAQFYRGDSLLTEGSVKGKETLGVLCRVSLKKNQIAVVRIVDDGAQGSLPGLLTLSSGGLEARNEPYRLDFSDTNGRLWDNCGVWQGGVRVGPPRWPEGMRVKACRTQVIENGPARAVVKRTFEFEDPARRYEITFDFRAQDPWIGVHERYDLGKGSFIRMDLADLKADTVYHPHTYNARTFKPDGKAEDSTLEPPQHPIATLGPIWRDIWFGGGSHAFVYNSAAEYGIGFAAVKGSQWKPGEGVSLVSQNLKVHGDAGQPGRVRVELPTDGGERHWAMIVGPVDLRKRIGGMIRAHADIPLQTVLDEWVCDWDSTHEDHSFGMAGSWFGPFNQHQLNPTTFPRRVRSYLAGLLEAGKKVKSRDLVMLAYVFSNPDYWPGPEYGWGNVGNPNFHTDMYNVPLQIGLVMPDHPHAQRWVKWGVDQLYGNLMRDSYPGGAWAESLSYSQFFFHVAEYARRIEQAGVARPFAEWGRLKEVATYLAAMHTPVDPRYGSRQKAPIGDTHPGNYVEDLHKVAGYYASVDDGFAEQLKRFPQKWTGNLDLNSRAFYGFGAMLRGNAYDDRNESFVTIKAGPARNHYQGDELSFHFCSLATPLAIDYACHYSPRPWSASMHNRPDMNGLRPVAVAEAKAFAASDVADVFVAEEVTRRISHVPMEPHETVKPGWEYPETELPAATPWRMRRYAMLVKHDPAKSAIADYLVLRDEIDSPQPVWWNLHVLARDIERAGQVVHFTGQLDVDVEVHFMTPALAEIEKRQWGWSRERTNGTLKNWKGKQYADEHFGHYIPEDFERGTWGKSFEASGEMGQWLRVRHEEGSSEWLVILMPHLKGKEAPRVEKRSATSAKITLGDEVEIVHLGSDGEYQAAVERGGRRTVLLTAGRVN